MMYFLIAFVLYLIVVGASQRGNGGMSGAFRVGAGDDSAVNPFDDHKMVLMGERDLCTNLSLEID